MNREESVQHFLDLLKKSRRGNFKVYIGMIAGVGKSYRMLSEAHELLRSGIDVRIGYIETHGRTETEALVGGLPLIPRRKSFYKGKEVEDMDLDAILNIHPEVVVVDELAHTNIEGSKNEKRWQDVMDILEAGISVITAVNIQHLEGLNEEVQDIAGIEVKERIPDSVLEQADEVVNIDLTADELAAAPAQTKSRDNKPANEYKFVMAVSPLDCMGCGECVTVCPTKAIQMVPQESQADQQAVFDYCVANISKKPSKFADDTVIGSQFNQPLLEFSGSCAGCAETSYARLITQLFGEKMYISNATGCSSIWGGTASISPYTVNKDSGHGPAWCNSLFEDNAEHGLGLYLGQKTVRENLIKRIAEVAGSDKASAELKAAFDEFMATKNNTKANDAPAKALIAELEKAAAAGCTESAEILKSKEFIAKKSVWIFGGDGWAYDIGFGGLDHVLASGEDVNVMVFDTEMYSNTGGQASKASNIGEVCQFAAAGKEISKKSLSEIAMTYGYIYVAQIALGANMNQAVKAIAEAEAYPGPSLIIGYAPCELHGVKGGMTNCQNEMKKAVEAGYWNLFTFNPANKAQGKNPFTLTSKAVDAEKYQALLANETRYSRLTRAFPDRAKQLFARNEQVANDRYEHLTRLVELYK